MGTADGTPAARRRVRPWLAALTALLVAGAVAVASLDAAGRLPGGLLTESPVAAPSLRPEPTPSDAPDVLAAPTADAGSSAVAPALPLPALERVLATGALGPDVGALVVDVGSGTALLDRGGVVPRTPASVAKLATGAAALTTLDPSSRLRTKVVRGTAPDELVLVGGGDTTLTARRAEKNGHPIRASLVDLADATVAALGPALPTDVTLLVDDGLFTGPAVSPDWRPTYVGSGVVSPVSALSVDGGRVDPTSDVREADPAVAAGRRFARLLQRRGLSVAGPVERVASPVPGPELAAVDSPTVAQLVEVMLTSSDNDLAESLFRLAALGSGLPGTFADGGTAVVAALDALDVPTDGVVLLDGSGLARGSALSPQTMARLLLAAAEGAAPELDRLVTGLPVAGFSGTLSLRFGSGRAGRAGGLVRAKTGTLTGVSTLAGVAAPGGRPIVFVVMADGVPGDTLAAQAALDRFAATLAQAS